MGSTPLLAAFFLVGLAWADAPPLAPSIQDLDAAEARLVELQDAAEATRAATVRLQAAWTRPTPSESERKKRKSGGSSCDDHARLVLGWRIERFGAAWREAAQAWRAQADRVRGLRAAPTVLPLVDERRAARLDAALAGADASAAAFVQASAWQVAYVRPTLAACPLVGVGLSDGLDTLPVAARGEDLGPVAVLAVGDGFVCPGAIRADDAVVLVAREPASRKELPLACWAPDATCACTPVPVFPAAVLGPPVVEGTGEPAPP